MDEGIAAACVLADMTGLPLIHLDNEFWNPNWEKTPRDEWIKKQETAVVNDQWIMDGNYNGTLGLRFAADSVIFLDISRIRCLMSVPGRHGEKRPDLPQTPFVIIKNRRQMRKWLSSH